MFISESEKPFIDLSSQVDGWLHALLALAVEYALSAMITELKSLSIRHKLPGFQLAVASGSNREKSLFLNCLLDRSLVRVKTHADAEMVLSIVAGQSEQMEIRYPDGLYEVKLLTPSSWNELLVNTRFTTSRAKFPHVRLTLEHTWLREMDVALVDMPVLGVLNDQRTVLLSEILRQSDVAIFIVNAVAPLSLTEIAFLEQEVLGRHVPRIIVVVAGLDKVPEEEREEVLALVSEKVSHIAQHVMVFPFLATASTCSTGEITAIQTQIAALAQKPQRLYLRNLQVAKTLVDYVQQLVDHAQSALASLHMHEVERQREQKDREEEKQLTRSRWSEIGRGLDERRVLVDEEVRQRLGIARENILTEISLELFKTQDPKGWWEKDLPLLLHREFSRLARDEESYVLGAVADDLLWLCNKVSSVFGVRMDPGLRRRGIYAAIKADMDVEMQLTDIERLRLFARIGSGAAMILNYLLFLNPLGAALGGAIGVTTEFISEYALSKKIDEQRQRLRNEVVKNVNRAMDEYAHTLSKRLVTIYTDMVLDILRIQGELQIEKETAIHTSATLQNEAHWKQLIDQASVLQQEILLVIEGSNPDE